MNPRREAIAFRIWAYANPLGWDCLVTEIAEALDLPMAMVRQVCARRGRNHRLRRAAYNVLDINFSEQQSRIEIAEEMNRLGGGGDGEH